MDERVECKLENLGKSFVKMPRKLLSLAFGSEKKSRLFGRVYIALVSLCYFKDGTVKLGKNYYTCHRGEYLGTYRELADRADISLGSVGYYLKELSQAGLIEYGPIAGGTRVKICNYDYFSGFFVKEESATDEAQVAARAMAAAEKAMGGRSMQNPSAEGKEDAYGNGC
ncbi:winged helix-turn-helix domain-containing protein [uncultured Parabacteroides sp.]|jgi:hypothetical protein|uniref:winged helix-turn-helix domain-containing protein n=1 Tax=uncultured Parabacteroides sp. TaxID=512312 RepID=UPI0025D60D8F|nr:winged helix-turn-helix domain-containing protein [uncultured Parabacteroides sp.]